MRLAGGGLPSGGVLPGGGRERGGPVKYSVYVSGSGTAACPWSLSLADFLEFEALRAALDDEFELLVAALNARLRRVDRCSADWRAALVAEHGLSCPSQRSRGHIHTQLYSAVFGGVRCTRLTRPLAVL